MKVEKFKRKANIRVSTGGRLEVNFFLGDFVWTHPGKEIILDVLNSETTFIPLEDILTNEIILTGKSSILDVELSERELYDDALAAQELPVWVELINGDTFEGSFFARLPPDRQRLSDFLNLTPRFIYLCLDQNDRILNKEYILSVKHR
jgi:hypothetical protein